jgi:tRNA U55 pseudouridine synthase TruB
VTSDLIALEEEKNTRMRTHTHTRSRTHTHTYARTLARDCERQQQVVSLGNKKQRVHLVPSSVARQQTLEVEEVAAESEAKRVPGPLRPELVG